MATLTFQDTFEILSGPAGVRWTAWWKYNPLIAPRLWEEVAVGNAAGATVLNADGSFIREYRAKVDDGDVIVKLVITSTTAGKDQTTGTTWYKVAAGVLVDRTVDVADVDWRIGRAVVLDGAQILVTIPNHLD